MNLVFGGIPLGKYFGIRVVLSWMFPLWALFEFSHGDITYNAIWMALLFGLVLIHEFGHCLACRSVGGVADHILLWPLGGLAFCSPPLSARAWFITTLGGPMVNVILVPVFWGVLTWINGHDVAPGNWALAADTVFLAAEINFLLLVFNMIPAYPMDGGRLLQELLWFAVGYKNSLQIAGMVGTVAGASLVVMGLGALDMALPVFIPGIGHSLFHLSTHGEFNWLFVVIGILSAQQSFTIYRQSQLIESWRKAN